MTSRVIYAAGLAILIGGMQYLVGLSGSGVAVVASALLLAFLPFGVWALLETEASTNLDLFLPPAAGTAGVLAGGALRWASVSAETMPADLLATALCAVCGGVVVAVRARRRRSVCPLRCGRYMTGRGRQCPRCGQVVCGHSSCWRKDGFRCADCDWLSRPLLAADEDEWWRESLGREVTDGACERCNCYAGSCPLYACGDCRWPTCTRCWDDENGRCTRCGWIIPDLPEELLAHFDGGGEPLPSGERAYAPEP